MKRLVLMLALPLLASPALAKQTKPAPSTHKPQSTPVAERSPSSSSSPSPSSSSDDATPPATTTTANGKTVKTKTYTFGAMDVEGKLKTPQLLYFLNRVKLELDMSAPDKRSFMKELERSADDKNL